MSFLKRYYNMFKIMMFKKQNDKAEICIGHARYIAEKYGKKLFIFTKKIMGHMSRRRLSE